MFSQAKQFIVEVRRELSQVHWPTRREALYLSLVVIIFSLLLAGFLGGFDLFFTSLLKAFVI